MLKEREREREIAKHSAVSLTNTLFPHHGNSPYPILAGTRVPVVKDYLTTEMHKILDEREEMQRHPFK